jgi:acyl-CoA synthetase (AMP-forming)/AMP-acid ligase II
MLPGDVARLVRFAARFAGQLRRRDLARLLLSAARGRIGAAQILDAHARAMPEKPAVIAAGARLTFAQLAARTRALVLGAQALGARRRDRVVVFMGNRAEWSEITAAAGSAGFGLVTASSRLKQEELHYILADAGVRLCFFGPEQRPVVEALCTAGRVPESLLRGGFIALDDHDGAGVTAYSRLLADGTARDGGGSLATCPGSEVMIYTSGTTGDPKGAVRGASAAFAAVGAFVEELALCHDDRHLVVCPLYHSAPAGLSLLHTMLGATLIIEAHFDPERTLRALSEHEVTTAFLVPYMLKHLLALPAEVRRRHPTPRLRAVLSSAERLPQDVKEGVLDWLGPVLYEFYGSTETGINTMLRPEEMRAKPHTVGRAVPGSEIRILDEDGRPVAPGEVGEVWVRTRALVRGYHGKPEATARAFREGFMSVGDLGRLDADGYLYLAGRRHDMVISAGVNIYPAEIERTLRAHPAVDDVAIVGVPDPEWGEALYAYIVRAPGTELTDVEVIAYTGEHLAGYKKPRHVEFVDDLPRNPTGKVLKRVLRQRAAERLGRAEEVAAEAAGGA